jgi:tetratricopeptide (TPR) repeat protein
VGDRAGLATTLNNIGGVYDSLGQREVALEYYGRALPIMEEVGDRYGESVTRYNVAMIYRAQGRLAEAVAELKRVVELDRLVQHPDLESHVATLARVEAELAAQQT